ncbi:membrane protein insertion efficiency factor YidD [Kingella negevensis]|uniref:membrane protein insertion efficiency factor YidD n=1 Tax=Kingella negevensis TaxID=1522312 RepID=UPI00254BD678|nr:membrane protein insertion efficiency factor YidD [Kingella negevensis]MDK4684453.1 membrane protein insertion efficiency factor YidD [Kingella negevensis]
MLKKWVLWNIRAYQKYVSPRKGFSCAYRVVYGGCGCSGVGYRLIRRFGVFSGCILLRRRFAHCRFAYEHFCKPTQSLSMGKFQRGFCDVPCDIPCDGDCGLTSTQSDCLDAGCNCMNFGGEVGSCRDERPREPKKKPIRVPNLAGSDDE